MKKINQYINHILILILFLLLFAGGLIFYLGDFELRKKKVIKNDLVGTTGKFLLTNSRDGMPIPNYRIFIMEDVNASPLASAMTNVLGKAEIRGLTNGKNYILKIAPDDKDKDSISDEIGITYTYNATGDYFNLETYKEREATHIKVPNILQNPELPNGCEISSLTAVLNYYGINVSKTTMSDDYLPKTPFSYHKGKRIGPNPEIAYAGNPRDSLEGWYVFAEPIKNAAEEVIATYNADFRVQNISDSSREELLNYLEMGIPVITWVTLDLSKPRKRGGWFIEGTDEFHSSYLNLHAVVLIGWENGKVHVMNPHIGLGIHSEDLFFDSYEALGSQAVIVW